MSQIAGKYQLNPQMLSQWTSDCVKNAALVFDRGQDETTKLKKELADKETRYQQIIEQMSYESYWLKKIWSQIARVKNTATWLT